MDLGYAIGLAFPIGLYSLERLVLLRVEFVPGFVIEDACIWFFADQTDFPFTPGNYSVYLALNGVTATPMISFSIVEP